MISFQRTSLCQKVSISRKKFLLFFLLALSFTLSNSINAQESSYNVAIIAKEVMLKESKCFDIQIVNKEDNAIYLAGQNYRLYYNANEAFFKESSLTSHLSNAYLDLRLNQHFFDVDASGFGVLPFDSNLGFVNFGTDYKLISADAAELLPNIPFTTAQMCFDATEGVDFTWAQEEITATYATAFVEIALINDDKLIPAKIIDYKVIDSQSTSVQDERIENYDIFPNPFRESFEVDLNNPLEEQAEMQLFDVFGKLVKSKSLAKGTTKIKVEGHNLLAGAYILNIKRGNSSSSIKILKINR